jgi:hypothetical protein
MTAPSSPTIAPAALTNAQDAHALTARFDAVMDALVEVVQQETDLVRGGRLGAAAKLQDQKNELTRLYIADTLQLQASQTPLARIVGTDKLAAMRQRHDGFRALLTMNMTVLATAHAVSEGIVRGVSGAMTRQAAPQTYGASGRAVAPSKSASQPLAVSRML